MRLVVLSVYLLRDTALELVEDVGEGDLQVVVLGRLLEILGDLLDEVSLDLQLRLGLRIIGRLGLRCRLRRTDLRA